MRRVHLLLFYAFLGARQRFFSALSGKLIGICFLDSPRFIIDLECGWNAGVQKSLLVRTGYGAETEQKHADKMACAVVDECSGAAEWILRNAMSG